MPAITERIIGQLNLTARLGCDFIHTVTVEGRDVSGSTFTGTIRKEKTLKDTFTITNTATTIVMKLIKSKVNTLGVGWYEYDVKETDVDGNELPYYEGKFEIKYFNTQA